MSSAQHVACVVFAHLSMYLRAGILSHQHVPMHPLSSWVEVFQQSVVDLSHWFVLQCRKHRLLAVCHWDFWKYGGSLCMRTMSWWSDGAQGHRVQ